MSLEAMQEILRTEAVIRSRKHKASEIIRTYIDRSHDPNFFDTTDQHEIDAVEALSRAGLLPVPVLPRSVTIDEKHWNIQGFDVRVPRDGSGRVHLESADSRIDMSPNDARSLVNILYSATYDAKGVSRD